MHKASDTTKEDDRLLTSEEVAVELGIKPGTLRQWRSKGRGPRYLKRPGPPQADVRYRAKDVEEWRQDNSRYVVIEPTR